MFINCPTNLSTYQLQPGLVLGSKPTCLLALWTGQDLIEDEEHDKTYEPDCHIPIVGSCYS